MKHATERLIKSFLIDSLTNVFQNEPNLNSFRQTKYFSSYIDGS